MTAWIGFGIAVAFVAAVALLACALVGIVAVIHRLWRMLSVGCEHPEAASSEPWASDAIKARIASLSQDIRRGGLG